MSKNIDEVKLIKLRSIANEIELGMIKAILDENNIPYIVKDHGPGGHMRLIGGVSLFGTDIMVAQADVDRANSLLESIIVD